MLVLRSYHNSSPHHHMIITIQLSGLMVGLMMFYDEKDNKKIFVPYHYVTIKNIDQTHVL